MINDRADCGTCACKECPDCGQPHNLRVVGEEDCAAMMEADGELWPWVQAVQYMVASGEWMALESVGAQHGHHLHQEPGEWPSAFLLRSAYTLAVRIGDEHNATRFEAMMKDRGEWWRVARDAADTEEERIADGVKVVFRKCAKGDARARLLSRAEPPRGGTD